MARNGDRPSLWQMVRATVAASFEERVLRERTARMHRLRVDAAASVLEEVVRRVEPETDGFERISWPLKRQLDETESQDVRAAALEASLTSPHLIGYLKSLKRFVLGKGPTFRPVTEDEQLGERLDQQWASFRRFNDWDSLEDEIPIRAWRDGEAFVRRHVQRSSGPIFGGRIAPAAERELAKLSISIADLKPPTAPAGTVFLRIIAPEHVRDPSGAITHGILTAEQDVQTVLGYCYAPDENAQRIREVIPAEQVLHVKIRVDADVKRGRSALEPLLRLDKQFQDWLRYRIALNLARTAIVLVKTIEGTPGQVAGLRNAQAAERESPGQENRLKMLKPMTTVHATPGVKYEFLSPNLNAQDARTDGRNILLAMAAATGLPEYMFTADASNANYSSTMVAEAPAVREFEDWQDFLTPSYRRIWHWVMRAAAEAKAVEGLRPEDLENGKVDVEVAWPPMIARDEQKEVERDMVLHGQGVLSDESLATRAGLDWARELERLKQERATAGEHWSLARMIDALVKLLPTGGLTPDAALENRIRELLGVAARIEDQPL
jgi:hypothetical protein